MTLHDQHPSYGRLAAFAFAIFVLLASAPAWAHEGEGISVGGFGAGFLLIARRQREGEDAAGENCVSEFHRVVSGCRAPRRRAAQDRVQFVYRV